MPSEGDDCSMENDGELGETELEELKKKLLEGGSRIFGVVERALISLVGSVEVSCGDGFRCSSEGMCERIEGIVWTQRCISAKILFSALPH